MERIWKERSWPNLMCYSNIYPEGLRKPRKSCPNRRSPGLDLNPGTPEYEAEILTTKFGKKV
jgi:hypothetical protein